MPAQLDLKNKLPLLSQLKALRLSKQKRLYIHRRLGRKTKSYNKKRLRSQQDLDGKRFKARADGKREKMFKGLNRYMHVKANDKQASIGWANPLTARIAYAHQHGIDEQMTAEKANKGKRGNIDYDAPASRKQAKELRQAGYKIKRGKGWKTPTLRWIQDNLSVGKAGLVLKILKDEESKQRWTLPTHQREFHGITQQEQQELLNITAEMVVKYT